MCLQGEHMKHGVHKTTVIITTACLFPWEPPQTHACPPLRLQLILFLVVVGLLCERAQAQWSWLFGRLSLFGHTCQLIKL